MIGHDQLIKHHQACLYPSQLIHHCIKRYIYATHCSVITCKNTKNGRHYLADTSGRVCSRQQMNFATGCCPDSIDPYSCETCKDLDGCCSSYEHCVSCCMAPKHVPKERMAETYIGLFKYVLHTFFVVSSFSIYNDG